MEVGTQGSTMAVGDAASPETFSTIAGIEAIPEIRDSKGQVEVTAIDDLIEQFIHGLREGSEIDLQGSLEPGNAGQTALKAVYTNKTTRNFKVTLTDSPATVITFSAKAFNWRISLPAKGRVMFACTLKLTTAVTVT